MIYLDSQKQNNYFIPAISLNLTNEAFGRILVNMSATFSDVWMY
jgi:hypothetical protein